MSGVPCPHCGHSMPQADAGAAARDIAQAPHRYNLETLAVRAGVEKAYDETVKTRVSQEDIRKLVEKRSRRKA